MKHFFSAEDKECAKGATDMLHNQHAAKLRTLVRGAY